MRFVLPILLFASLIAIRIFMNSIGWNWLSASWSGTASIIPVADKAFVLLSSIFAIWIAISTSSVLLEKSFEKVLKGSPLAKKLLPLLKHVAHFLIIAVGAFFLLQNLGVNVSALLTGAWVWGLVFALASKELASNLFGSLALIFGKHFKIGDRIRIKGFEGEVEEISLSHTKIADKTGHSVYVPNKFLTGEPIENLSDRYFKSGEIQMSVKNSAVFSKLEKAFETIVKKHGGSKFVLKASEISDDTIKASLRYESPADVFESFSSEILKTALSKSA